ncbi:hypothetical protein C8R45DRAFT_1026642 [Mycena sanguinolenta]|nr:hypothetical protein C8R45DRAFT_1026642 [Mycena sanguinolenta]
MDEVRVSSVFEKNIDSTSASTAPSLLSRNWETSAAFRYGYDMQPNQSLSTSDLSTSIFGFDTHDFGNNLSWPDSFVSNDPDPSLSSLAQLLPATSLPQFPTSLIAASSFSSAPVVDAPIAGSNLNYQPPMLDDAAQFFSATSLPQLPTSLPAASSFAIAPAVVDTTSTTSRKRKRRDETDTDRANMIQGNARTEGSEAL